MRYMSRLLVRLTAAVIVLVACSSVEGENGIEQLDESSTMPSERLRVRQTDWDFVASSDGGARLHLSFVGGKAGDLETEPCATDYEVETVESETEVDVTVWQLEAKDKSQLPAEQFCTAEGHPWTVDVRLEDFIGERRISGSLEGQTKVPSIDDLLVPTRLPEGSSWIYGDATAPAIFLGYGGGSLGESQGGSEQSIVVYMAPETPRLFVIEEATDIEGSTSVSVRSAGDGVIATRNSGATVLAFVHSGWAYRVGAQPGVDEAVLREFVANMRAQDELDAWGFSSGMEAPEITSSPESLGSSDLDVTSRLSSHGRPAAQTPPVATNDETPIAASGTVDWEAAFTSGRAVTVTFLGGRPGEPDVPCAKQYQLRATERDDEVVLAVDFQGFQNVECDAIGYEWAVMATLDEPLGDRRLVSAKTGEERRSTQLETRLEPTWLPNDLRLTRDNRELPQRGTKYGPVEDPDSLGIQVQTSPITMNPRVHGLRQIDGHETVTIRNDDDGVSAVMFDGRPVVGFEEQGWYYRIVGEVGIERDELLEFARSFERPSLFDRESLPDRLTVPFFESELQAGQG